MYIVYTIHHLTLLITDKQYCLDLSHYYHVIFLFQTIDNDNFLLKYI